MPGSHDVWRRWGAGVVTLWPVVFTVALAVVALPRGEAQSADLLAAYGIGLDLPDGWRMADARMTTSDPDLADRGDSLYQAAFEKALAPEGEPTGEADRATLLLTVQNGPRPFATGASDLKRIERDLRDNLTRTGEGLRQVDRVAAARLASGDPAIAGWLSGSIGGRPYRQRLLLCTGARYSYMLVFQAYAEAWPRWEAEWDQLVATVELADPYPWPDTVWSLRGSALILAGMITIGMLARGRMSRRRLAADQG